MNEMLKSYIIPIEAYSYYILYTLSKVSENAYNIDIYQHFICLFFLLLMIFLIIIIYYDTIYKIAKNTGRCRDIDITSKINENLEYPYIYNIYIVNKKDVKKLLNNYIFYIQYNFVNKNTRIFFNNNNSNIISPVIFPYKDNDIDNEINEQAFYYYDLEKEYGYPIEHKISYNIGNSNNEKIYYINKNIITSEDYTFIISRYDNKIILDDPSASELLNFVKKYGYNPDDTNLSSIYNIYYAIDNKKNKLSI
jgi:hypothetical protein